MQLIPKTLVSIYVCFQVFISVFTFPLSVFSHFSLWFSVFSTPFLTFSLFSSFAVVPFSLSLCVLVVFFYTVFFFFLSIDLFVYFSSFSNWNSKFSPDVPILFVFLADFFLVPVLKHPANHPEQQIPVP